MRGGIERYSEAQLPEPEIEKEVKKVREMERDRKRDRKGVREGMKGTLWHSWQSQKQRKMHREWERVT